MLQAIENFFDFNKLKTNFRTEILAGVTTFVSMAYILFVNPTVLGDSGMDKGAVFVATGLIAAISTIFMGLVAKYPFAIAPGLGINAFFAYTVVIGMKVPWQTALSAVFVAGIIFFLTTISGLREKIINSIPSDLKSAIAAGIGLFIAFLGLSEGGIVSANTATIVGLGDLAKGTTLLAIFGILVTFILYARKIPAAIFIGMVLTAIAGIVTGLIKLPTSIVTGIPSINSTFGQAFFRIGSINTTQLWIAVLTFLLVAFFDTTGTLIGVAKQAGLINKEGELPRAGQALMADSVGMLGGAILGTSPTTAYIESSSGIAVGGRSGFTSVITGIMFLLALFFSPLLSVVTSQVTAPALVLVGVLMAANLADIDWKDFPIAASALMVVIGMPLTYSISDGIALGFISYPILMVSTNRAKEVNWLMYVLALIFIIFLIVIH